VTSRQLRRLLQAGFALLLLAGLYFVRTRPDGGGAAPSGPVGGSSAPAALPSGPSVIDAFRAHRSNVDLAPRVPLAPGDSVEVRGEYDWNDRGGVLHWTHRDPGGRHEAGWVRHDGRLYQ